MRSAKIAKILLSLLFLLLVIQPAHDPDLGWHLRYGQYFFQTGHVLRDNIISFVWPQYKWVQASWGYDLIVYQLFTHFGFLGLSLTAGLLTFLTFCIVTRPQKRLNLLQLSVLGIIFIALVGPMWGGGMRTPTISTVFMAIAIVLSDRLLDPEGRKTPRWVLLAIPILFLVWANLHGGFALGLILVTIQWAIAGVVSRIKKVRLHQYWFYGTMLALSWATPLINPWGIRVYEETFKHTTNTNLLGISEWAPLTTMPVEAVITGIITACTIVLLLRYKKMSAIPLLAIITIITYLAFSANRFVIILGVVVVYALARILPRVHIRFFQKISVKWAMLALLVSLVSLDLLKFQIYLTLPNPQILTFTWNDYCNYTLYCSEPITTLMSKNPPKGNGFHIYNYGGYLSWRVPEVKTFIDGRMAAWEENGQSPPVLEGDWIAMPKGPVAFIKYDQQYHFTWAIVPAQSDITQYLTDLTKSDIWTLEYQNNIYSYFVKK